MNTNGRDLRKELEDDDETFPESWRPNVGDILVGEVLRYDSGHTEYGEYPICVVKDEATGQPAGVWLLHAVLRGEFEKLRPKVGERVGIRRLSDSTKGYKRYAVRVDRPEADVPDFSRFAPAGDVDPADLPGLLTGESVHVQSLDDVIHKPAPIGGDELGF